MDKEIEKMVRSCKHCCEKQNDPPKSKCHHWEQPQGSWQRIHVDFAGPENGYYYFIIVDAFSKWVEVIPTRTTTTEFCLRELRKLFTNFGLPLMLVSDNGPQFTSHLFKEFLETNFIVHSTTANFHPSTNGQAERFVQTIKKHLHAMSSQSGDIHLKIARLLMQLRKVPNSEAQSPYMMMLGRDPRTRLDTIFKPTPKIQPKSDEPFTGREFEVGTRVQARNYARDAKWKFGVIKRKEGKLHYWIKLDDGREWRRHVDQIRKSLFGGDNVI